MCFFGGERYSADRICRTTVGGGEKLWHIRSVKSSLLSLIKTRVGMWSGNQLKISKWIEGAEVTAVVNATK